MKPYLISDLRNAEHVYELLKEGETIIGYDQVISQELVLIDCIGRITKEIMKMRKGEATQMETIRDIDELIDVWLADAADDFWDRNIEKAKEVA